jgi:hypothetical protein
MALRVRVETHVTKEDAALLVKVAKGRRTSEGAILRQALMEWLARNGFLNENEARMILGLAGEPAPKMAPLRSTSQPQDCPPSTRWSP